LPAVKKKKEKKEEGVCSRPREENREKRAFVIFHGNCLEKKCV
jgi:hypothetical protein